jgi:hypothetical protein
MCNPGCSDSNPGSEVTICPESGTIGPRVDLITVKALLRPSALRRLEGKDYHFCPTSDCEVVYFDRGSGSRFRRTDLLIRVGQKESEDPIPVCYCFDFTIADLHRDLATRGETNIPETITQEIRTGHCACEVKNPEGVCCLGNVREAVKRIKSDISQATPRSQRAQAK